jgi:predicted Fe-Mo cluster-binding NifX family protein
MARIVLRWSAHHWIQRLGQESIGRNLKMKIAVASIDGRMVSECFERSRCLLVFDVQNRAIVGGPLRKDIGATGRNCECQDGGSQEQQYDVVDALRDCDAVVVCGIDCSTADALRLQGILAYVASADTTPEQAVVDLLKGKLKQAGGFCNCHH